MKNMKRLIVYVLGGAMVNLSTEFSEEEKDLMVRVFSHYLKTHVYEEMTNEDIENVINKANEEEFKIKLLAIKLGIRRMFPQEIDSRM